MKKPIILIPTSFSELASDQSSEFRTPRYHVYKSYSDLIIKSGGIPLLITRPNNADILQICEIADGVLLSGGHDISPDSYGENDSGVCRGIDKERDRVEFTLLAQSLKKRIPILAICRGIQVLNVHMRGTLYQHITDIQSSIEHDYSTNENRSHIAHTVNLIPNSQLQKILSTASIAVNSIHHQAINELGEGLLVSGRAEDGIVEAVEIPEQEFCIGVQWHPEELQNGDTQKLFSSFITSAYKYHTKNRPEGLS